MPSQETLKINRKTCMSFMNHSTFQPLLKRLQETFCLSNQYINYHGFNLSVKCSAQTSKCLVGSEWEIDPIFHIFCFFSLFLPSQDCITMLFSPFDTRDGCLLTSEGTTRTEEISPRVKSPSPWMTGCSFFECCSFL